MSAATPASERVIVVEPSRRLSVDLPEVWAYRELLFFFIWRDIKVRYKQTVLGAAWAVIQPVSSMIVFSIIFGRFAKIPSDGLPYPVFVFAGLLPWSYFAASLTSSSGSIVANTNLVTKVYFPRLIVPITAVTIPLVDFLLALAVLICLMAGYGIAPSWHVFAFPLFLLFAMTIALGAGLWLSALNVRYRDVPYALPFITQLLMYASPVIYPVTLVPGRWQWVLSLNPMVGVIDGFRWAIIGQGHLRVSVLATSAAVGAILLVSGAYYFKSVERRFADII